TEIFKTLNETPNYSLIQTFLNISLQFLSLLHFRRHSTFYIPHIDTDSLLAGSGPDHHSGSLSINIPEYYHLNRLVSNFDRTHNLQITNISELPFGSGKRFLNEGGFLSVLL